MYKLSSKHSGGSQKSFSSLFWSYRFISVWFGCLPRVVNLNFPSIPILSMSHNLASLSLKPDEPDPIYASLAA